MATLRPLRRLVPALASLVVAACWTGSEPTPASRASASPSATSAPPATPPAKAPRSSLKQARCEISVDPPVRATSLGQLRVVPPPDDEVVTVALSMTNANTSMSSVLAGTAVATAMSLSPGTYQLAVETRAGLGASCDDVAIAAGGATTVTIVP